ncbi:hypothetical protein A3J19_02910 [Candidatus Daviesbacteria bacterium RIFCSPLOWO2_02_FULL_41_8]|uniref:DDH domain-containing protein n=1 Tax=Candidatus Daviesbacteria bacterium RIFCSPLOWO2_02_FULL_41_8 TaxID=1797798 RepID=A0A1F5NLQ6_9BACT|nr:MAG: hypothetical protein A2967_01915 [Candidatus Daviesbacteria bacterium RIFCSPLOWO2_01_FULL_41_32]OGE78483.1 MAG: hypothetical protein A3J19_02910 [Candidatus Daviesbacteria bacterium RIFCSPLOWO2_02_FULL_41_8]
MKYDSQLAELKNLLPSAKNILIAIPTGADVDKLAAGLALFLIFEAQGKQVSIVSDDAVLVSHTHLFGVDHIQKTLSSTEGGNLTLTLEGVASPDGTVPALEKLDWYAENNNLNLVFHVLPNQIFQPARIVPRYQGSGFNLIFTIGAVNLNVLGSIYSANTQAFSGTHIANIDNQSANTSFGQTNISDTQAAALSEVVGSVVADLGFVLDADTASNLLAGIFDATNNLMGPKVTADTYMAVANCLRVGGRKPADSVQSIPVAGIQGQPVQVSAIPQQPTYDWNAVAAAIGQTKTPQSQSVPEFTVPPVVSSTGNQSQSSPEERPLEEGVVSETVEPEWLTPKIFKGTSVG